MDSRDDDNKPILSRRDFGLAVGACAGVAGCGKMPMMEDMGPADMGDPCGLGEFFVVPEASQLSVGQTLILPDKETIISRDQAGYMAMWSACRHSGCQLMFNSNQRVYDCPCHGSRYDIYGQVQRGPATDPLLHRDMCRQGGLLRISKTTLLPGTTKRTI